MSAFLRSLLYFLSLPPLLLFIIIFCAYDDSAITYKNWSLSSEDIDRAKQIVSNSTSKQRKTVKLSEKDLNIALSYLLNYYLPSTSEIKIGSNMSDFKISLYYPNKHFGKYINFHFNLSNQHGYPSINNLSIGKLTIANELAGFILETIINNTPLKDYYILAARHIRNIQITRQGVNIDYLKPKADLISELHGDDKTRQSYQFYQQQFIQIIHQQPPNKKISLAIILQPLFAQAYTRSNPETAITENRNVLMAVNSFINRNVMKNYLLFSTETTPKINRKITIYGRKDMAQHFILSAALTAAGVETLASMLGLEKEIKDSKKGSGFSFIDLASDRAGLYFGKMAIQSAESARQLQLRMSKINGYQAFMPKVSDLPESMNEQQFKQRFTSIYSVKYQNMLKEIDARIDALPIYQ